MRKMYNIIVSLYEAKIQVCGGSYNLWVAKSKLEKWKTTPKTYKNVAAEVISGPLVWAGITLARMNT